MANELIVVEKIDKDVLFIKEGVLDKVLDGIREQLDKFKPDTSTDANRKKIASMSRKVSSSKTFLDQIRKDKIAKAKEEIDAANGLWKPARETLEKWRDETRQPLTDWEAAEEAKEQERIAAVREKVDLLRCINIPETQEGLKTLIDRLETNLEITPDVYFEFTAEAFQIGQDKLHAARMALETRQRLDQEEAERKAEAESLAIEKKRQTEEAAKLKAQQDKLAAAQKKINDEKAALEAEKKAEQDRKDREQFEKEAKEQAVRDAREEAQRLDRQRVEKEKAEAEEVERQKALLPDKEKLKDFSASLFEISLPKVESEKAKEIVLKSRITLDDLAQTIFDMAHKM